MAALIRYGGSYLVDDLLLGRICLGDARGFNDPFEFHFRPGKPISNALAKQRIADAMRSPDVQQFVAQAAITYGLNREKRKAILKEHRARIVEEFKATDLISTEYFRDKIFSFTDEVCKVLCCTRSDVDDYGENTMWSYYAANHAGVRIHLHPSFFSQFVRTFNIDYHEHPPVYESGPLSNVPMIQKFVVKVLSTKSKAWKHEHEVRTLVPVHQTFQAQAGGAKRFFTKLPPSDVTRVDLGIRFENPSKIDKTLREQFPTLRVFRAEKAPDSYRIVYREI
jgi:hypothetical protein